MTSVEQIAEFVRRHPGEWQAVGHRFVAGGAQSFPGGASLETAAGYVVLTPGVRGVVVTVSAYGYEVARIGQGSGKTCLLTQIAHRIADALQIYGGAVSTLPPWLQDETRRVLRARAGELLTAAGFSPADVVSAAETLDEALCAREPVEPTFDAVVNRLLSQGMSCRWIKETTP